MSEFWKPALAWIVAIAVIVALSFAGGCSLDNLTVDVPRPVQQELNVPAKTTLREAPYLLEDYQRRYQAKADALDAEYQSGSRQFTANIEDTVQLKNLITQSVDSGVPIVNEAIGNAGIPGGLILSGLVTSLAGYLTGKSRMARTIPVVTKQAEDKGYDMGKSDTLDTVAKVSK